MPDQNMRFNFYKGTFLISFLLSIFFTGCGVYNNFTTYFNLYYNISDLFEQAETEIKLQKRPIFSTEDFVLPGGAAGLLNKVIEKSSNLLQFHGETAFVDDAVLILGKCFYYQKNFLKANRKFSELTSMTDSDLLLEAELWIGKTQFAIKDYEKGIETLQKVIAQAIEEDEDEIVVEAYAEMIRYRMKKEDYTQAIILINQMLGSVTNDEVNAEVNYELGRLYTKTNDYENAIIALQKVFTLSPTFDIEYLTHVELGRSYRALKQYDRAEDTYFNLIDEDKYKDKLDLSELELGLTYFENNDIENALSTLTYTDTAFTSSSSAGIARYKIGEIYQYHLKNFDSAAFYYQRAFNSTLPVDYQRTAREKYELFNRYKYISTQIYDFNKQKLYAGNDSLYIMDSIKIGDSIAVLQKIITDSLELVAVNNPERGGNTSITPPTVPLKLPLRTNLTVDSLKTILAKNELTLGNIFFTEMNLPDSAYKYYNNILTNYPGTAYYGSTLFSMGSYYLSIGDSLKADSIFNFVYDNYKNEPIVNAAAEKINKPFVDFDADSAKKMYTDAEKLMLRGEYLTSVGKFYEIFNKYPKSPYAPKALYAGGYMLENNLMMLDSAAVIFDSIMIKYPQTEYANKVISKLMTYKQEQDRLKKIVSDSLAQLVKQDSVEIPVEDIGQQQQVELEEKNKQTLTQEEKPGEQTGETLKPEIPSNTQLQNQRRGRGRYPSR